MPNETTALKFRRRSEGRALRPFANLEKIQERFQALTLKVNYEFGEEELQLGGSLELPARYLPVVGIRIEVLGEFLSELKAVIETANLKVDDLRFVLIARDTGRSPLRESELVCSIPIDALREMQQVVARDSERLRTMQNGFDGYILEAQIVLNRALKPSPLSPSLRGTIVASGEFRFSTNDISSSLQPRHLTNEVRTLKELPKDSWFYVEIVRGDILDTLALGEAVQVWVDDEYLRQTSLMTSSEGIMSEHIFIVSTMTTLVYEASNELNSRHDRGDAFYFDGTNSALLKLLFMRSKKYLEGASFQKFADDLRQRPERILSHCLSAGGMKNLLVSSARQMMGETDDTEA